MRALNRPIRNLLRSIWNARNKQGNIGYSSA
jgi:hypothetical protein